jgi:replicative DNA helicase
MDSRQDNSPPANIEAEKVVLGSLLRDGSLMDEAMSVLRSDHCFYFPEHRAVFQAMVNIHKRRGRTDIVTVRDELSKLKKRVDWLPMVDMVELTHDLLTGVVSTAQFQSHARIVWDKYRLRRLIQFSNDTLRTCYTEADDADGVLSNAQTELLRLATGDNGSGVSLAYDELAGVYESLEARKGGAAPLGSVKTSFDEIDEVLEPMEPGTLNVLAGRPSTGKTQLACQIATDVAIRQRRPVLMLSWEMTRRLITTRLACDVADVDKTKAKRGQLTADDWEALTRAQNAIHEAPLYLADKLNMDLFRVHAEARKLRGTSGLDLLIIDYLQLVSVPGRFNTSNDRIEFLSRSLKLLSMELGIPILLLSQLNLAGKDRKSPAPQLSDLRGSGAIGQDADTVLFTWHDSKGSYVEIAKQREGPRGKVELRFDRGRWYTQRMNRDLPY